MNRSSIHCRTCHKVVYFNEQVDLDITNSIAHNTCGTEGHLIKDSGTFEEMTNKYSFFYDD